MKEICPKNKCTGCEACANVCAHMAITMKPDSSGYKYPSIDINKCVDCGICQKLCPSLSLNQRYYPLTSLAVTTKQESDTLSSASGGAASLLSREVIRQGGVVYGCDGTNIRDVHHTRISTLEGVEQLKGSKYVQSAINDIYRQIRTDLLAGIKVLFIGTPCQVAGLFGFLRYKIYENLYTVDLVCHGVPSQQMLNDNIDYYTENKGDSCRVHFREKLIKGIDAKNNSIYRIIFGWFFQNELCMTKPIFRSYKEDPYMLGFISGLTFRPNCYECRYASVARIADLTLSDYWGLSNNVGFDKGKGVSNILINTLHGQTLWNQSKADAVYVERPLVEAIRGNGQLLAPSMCHAEHERFVRLYPSIGFKAAIEQCSKQYLRKLKIREILINLKKFVKSIL